MISIKLSSMKAFKWENTALDTHLILEASAGTGKTYSLERIILRLVAEYKVPLSRILVVTFTDPAARELKERVRGIFHQYRQNERFTPDQQLALGQAIRSFDDASIFTIHAFCKRMLKKFPLEADFDFQREINPESELLAESLRDYFRRNDPSGLDFKCFIKQQGNLEQGILYLEALLNRGEVLAAEKIIPEEELRRQALQLASDFENQSGRLYKAWQELCALDAGKEQIDIWRKEICGRGGSTPKTMDFLQQARQIKDFEDYLELFSQADLNMLKKWQNQDKAPFSAEALCFQQVIEAFFRESALFFSDSEQSEFKGYQIFSLNFVMQLIPEVLEDWENKKAEKSEIVFNDLIKNVHQAVKNNPAFRKALSSEYDIALIDEFQDTDLAQWEIFSTVFLSENKRLFLIGDPKQSIYRFRGADLAVYRKALSEMGQESLYHLDTNFRSCPELVDASNQFFKPVFQSSLIQQNPDFINAKSGKQGPKRLLYQKKTSFFCFFEADKTSENKADWEEQLFQEIVQLSQDILMQGRIIQENAKDLPVSPADIAVLCETNHIAESILDLMRQKNIPARLARKNNILESMECEDWKVLLQSLYQPSSLSLLKNCLLLDFFSLSPAEIQAMEKAEGLNAVQSLFLSWKQRIEEGHFFAVIMEILENQVFSQAIAGFIPFTEERSKPFILRSLVRPGGEIAYNRHSQLLEYLQLLHKAGKKGLRRLIKGLEKSDEELSDSKILKERIASESATVQIMTMHSSKGLQFPIVFFAGGLKTDEKKPPASQPYYFHDQKLTLDFLQLPQNLIKLRQEEWREKKRLYYVACTRAESALFMPLPFSGKMHALHSLYALLFEEEVLHEAGKNDFEPSEPLHPLFNFQGKKKTEANANLASFIKERLIKVIQEKSCFQLIKPTQPGQNYQAKNEFTADKLKLPQLKSQISDFQKRYPALYSYSSLHQEQDSDNIVRRLEKIESAEKNEEEQQELLQEKGAVLGEMVHELFEKIPFDFQLDDQSTLDEFQRIVTKYYNPQWFYQNKKALWELMQNTLEQEIKLNQPEICFRLQDLPAEKRKHELPFLLRLKNEAAIQSRSISPFKLQLKKGKSYLKGFIDLVFYHEDRFFLADWKTNWLGPSRADYHQQNIEAEMQRHNYFLQYRIYASALLKILKQQNPDFDYERNFGGCFYFFCRGMDKNNQEGRSFYFDRPSFSEIKGFYQDFLEDF